MHIYKYIDIHVPDATKKEIIKSMSKNQPQKLLLGSGPKEKYQA
jgi:hypothetical protein